MFYVYVLRCRDGSLYAGFTNGLKKRVAKHNAGRASKYTRSRLPAKLVASWKFKSKPDAMRHEAIFKSLTKKAKEAKVATWRRNRRPSSPILQAPCQS